MKFKFIGLLTFLIITSSCTDKGGSKEINNHIFINNETPHQVLVEFYEVRGLDNSKLLLLLDSGESFKYFKTHESIEGGMELKGITADSAYLQFNDSLSLNFSGLQSPCINDSLHINILCGNNWEHRKSDNNSWSYYYITENHFAQAK